MMIERRNRSKEIKKIEQGRHAYDVDDPRAGLSWLSWSERSAVNRQVVGSIPTESAEEFGNHVFSQLGK